MKPSAKSVLTKLGDYYFVSLVGNLVVVMMPWRDVSTKEIREILPQATLKQTEPGGAFRHKVVGVLVKP